MTNDDWEKLVDGLIAKTKSGEIEWTIIDDREDAYGASVGAASLILAYERDVDSDDVLIDLYDLTVLNRKHQLVGKVTNYPSWPGRGDSQGLIGPRLSQLFIAVRSSTGNHDQDIAELLREVSG